MSQELPTVSIIIPTYGMAEALQLCLQSVASQSLSSLEVIVCDGLGDRETSEIVETFTQLNLTHHVAPDRGVYDAMNTGIDLARGTWLYFLGADDQLITPRALQSLLSHYREGALLLAARVQNLPPRQAGVPEWHIPKWGALMLLKNTLHHQGVLYHRDLFEVYRYPVELKVLGDYHLNLTLRQLETPVILTDVALAMCSPGGLSKRFKAALYREEWALKATILPLGSKLYQPFWLALKYLWKNLR